MKSFYHILLLSLYFLTLGVKLNAQNQKLVDSLEQIIPNAHDTIKSKLYVELYKITFNSDLKKAGEYAGKCVDVANRSEYLPSIAQSYNLLGIHQLQTSDYKNAIHQFKNAIEAYTELDESERVFRAMNNLAIVYENQGRVEEALKTHLQVLHYLEGLNIGGDMRGSCLWNIGNVKHSLLKYGEALQWYGKAMEIYKKSKDTAYIIDLNYQIAMVHSSIGNLKKAEEGFTKCIEYYRKESMEVALIGALENLSNIYIQEERFSEAEKILMEAKQLTQIEGTGFLPGQINRRMTELNLATNNLKEAETNGLLSINNAQQFGRHRKLIMDYLLMSEVYERQNNFKESLHYYKMYHAQNDSIFGIEKLNSINALQLEYEEIRNQQEVSLLEEKNRVAQLKQNGLIGGILALIAIFSALTFALKQRLSKNRIAKEKVDQELAFSQKELEFQNQELTAYALQVAHKNEVLEGIKTDVSGIKVSNSRDLQKIIKTINFNQNGNDSWEGFRQRFIALHKDFEFNIQNNYPEITPNELRLMSLLKMNLSNKEIANILNISADGIKKARYRLRKKLDLDTSDSLERMIKQI